MFPASVGHFVSRYPKKSETFIQNDISAWNLNGSSAHIFAFFKDDGFLPPSWIKKIHYINPGKIYFKSQIHFILVNPLIYFQLLFTLIIGHLNNFKELIKILITWPSIIHAAFLVKKESLDAIHAHWGNIPATTTFVISKLLHKPYLFTLHAFDIYKKNTFLKQKLREAQMVMTCTEYNRKYLLEKYPFLNENKVKLAYHGVDLNLFYPKNNLIRKEVITEVPNIPLSSSRGLTTGSSILPNTLNMDPAIKSRGDGTFTSSFSVNDPFVLLTIGRMTAQKGFSTLILALKILKDSQFNIKLKFLALPGPTESEIMNLIETLDLKSSIEWITPLSQDKMITLYNSVHVTVLPCELSKNGARDGIPNIFLESMACSIPVISTDISGIPEILKDEQTGLVIPPGDPKKLAYAIQYMMQNSQKRILWGENARKLIEQYHDQKVCHQKIIKYLEEVYE